MCVYIMLIYRVWRIQRRLIWRQWNFATEIVNIYVSLYPPQCVQCIIIVSFRMFNSKFAHILAYIYCQDNTKGNARLYHRKRIRKNYKKYIYSQVHFECQMRAKLTYIHIFPGKYANLLYKSFLVRVEIDKV